ncbi:MAG: hypothetical protein A2583_07880 [Bdellovibrionales bacterium RIFOXYD1_FULL_53_11]|nr:MAG: hypothetical protein A2583_07880 [Bdellovibrionales bacterium RIFOXYD1_FULL_53_11]
MIGDGGNWSNLFCSSSSGVLIFMDLMRSRISASITSSSLGLKPSWSEFCFISPTILRISRRRSSVSCGLSLCDAGIELSISLMGGRSSRVFRPKSSRNSRVVEYSIGRPGSSERPAIWTRFFSIRPRKKYVESTPRTLSTSSRITGWR